MSVCVDVMQMLVFKLASLLPAVQGHMDSPAGVRVKVSQGNTFAIGARQPMLGGVVSHASMH